jgi:hypothetical protein
MNRSPRKPSVTDESSITRVMIAVGVLVAGFLLYAVVATFTEPAEPASFDASLPNPMGGPARTAPGEVSGELSLAGLEVRGSEVQMGDVGLGITYVPGWALTNPTDEAVSFAVGQPQVLEGCCPGPVYADGELTGAGQELTVAPGATLLLQFPLQMHPGMDGPHHLVLPLAAGEAIGALHVTGNFTADASA